MLKGSFLFFFPEEDSIPTDLKKLEDKGGNRHALVV